MTTQEQTPDRTAAPLRNTRSPAGRAWAAGAAVLAILLISLWLAINPEWVMQFGRWGYLGAFLISLVASATIFLPAPGIAVVIAMSAALDPVLLGIVAGVGSAIGELSGYIAGAGGRALVPEDRRHQMDRLEKLTDRYGVLALGVLAAIPLPLFDFAGIVAGMLRLNIASFVAAVSVGKSIKYILMIWLGAGPLYMLQHLPQLFGR